jgi:hypothetical protein
MKWVSRQECRGGAICASRIPICTCSRRCLRLPRQADRSAILREQRRCSWTARSPTRSWALSARRLPRTGSSTSLSDKIWSRSCTKSNRLGCCAHGNLHLYCQSATAWVGLSLTRWLTASTGSAAWSENIVRKNESIVNDAARFWPQTETIRVLCREASSGKAWPNLFSEITERLFRAHQSADLNGGRINQVDGNGTDRVDYMPANMLCVSKAARMAPAWSRRPAI